MKHTPTIYGLNKSKQTHHTLGEKLTTKIGIGLCALTMACQVFAGNLTASVNKQKIALNEPLQLSLTTDDMAKAFPDLSPLQQDFRVLGTAQSSQIQIINGTRSQSSQWQITLLPKQQGQVTIPAISMGSMTTQPIDIEVLSSGFQHQPHSQMPNQTQNSTQSSTQNQTQAQGKQGTAHKQQKQQAQTAPQVNINLTAEIGKGTLYQFQEIPITVRIEASQPLQRAQLIEPAVEGFELSQNGRDKNSTITRDGQMLSVIERQYLLRSQKSGDFTLPPFVLRGYIQKRQQKEQLSELQRQYGRELGAHFEEFFNSSFAGSLTRAEPFATQSEPIKLSIKTNPNSKNGEWFLPAKAVELQAEWQNKNPTFKVGEAVTRKIRLLALGARPEQLPQLTLPTMTGAKVYIDNDETAMQETAQGTQALRELSVSIVPTQAGQLSLPELSVQWFNTTTNQKETEILPAQMIEVVDPQGAMANTAMSNKNLDNNASTPSLGATHATADNSNGNSNSNINSNNTLLWTMLLLGLAVVMTIAVLIWRRKAVLMKSKHTDNQLLADTASNYNDYKYNDHKQQAEQAITAKNPQSLYQALLQWQSKGEVFSQPLQDYLKQLEQLCYNTKLAQTELSADDWQGVKQALKAQTKQQGKRQSKAQSKKNKGKNTQLPPLY